MPNNTTDYATSAQRKYELAQIVIEGEEAELVLKYAKKFKAQAQDKLLQTIADTDDEKVIIDVTTEYKASCRFVDMLKSLVATGEKKRNTLQGLK